ncbi:undecaprenyldiphospho-muramoylpentapeptide beta-N-acetylglucosaminyltransferase [Chlamydia pneumoniae]|uniref:UDP-N-acetylglucosamine--N-acetylmuramyl-(pentapeptide) pyrophosphoryl-undecaprenol N-acetylglucosamine transferase n=2 Tax=Chlamydia pneumoniae TaxID=83558 RepID=MURG_CHLPN|nr:undecaprenyldiphospho-muramoylpentapeptide beta-N-acetylglucosaminyltransferase [Chlamydia pneumoniae]Q9Z702.1 RecName: Full=UDP-N-acetylglucosamine--N-acetylmuramyl-(pentapeptide) pyrophosphoryl-undecaprenol N-acetylglucosamine transferase; AltName: Full=Undecaprenyl-PP-MurNAc-pentapeptide-UDPGlcNAc GlcNAc transferase [Chlamydia pneumoniae]AAD19042.1 Peptidoglycan Transferase [Chlamydia pneumoniae CWL029]AAF38742.1 UDP-N-acetylglucosamine--N-acetylmuramyl-(pentapeptide) pyrophosphoryl-undeca
MMKKIRKVALAVGGSGGHIVPALSVKEAFSREGIDVLLLGKGLKNHPSLQQGISYREIPSGLPTVLNPIKIMSRTLSLCSGYLKARKELKIFDPDLVIGFGSYHSLPVLLAGLSHKIPLFLHEQNLVPGKVNQLFSRYARGIGVNFSPVTKHFRCPAEEVFLPKRSFSLGSPMMKRCTNHTPTICVVGGSQGAQILNTCVPQALVKLVNKYPNMYVHHIVGPKSDVMKVQHVYNRGEVLCCVKPFEEQLLDVLLAADLVISRAGATILEEILWAKVPGILIPYPGAYGHQEVNAKFFVDVLEGGTMILEKELTEKLLVEKVTFALDSHNREKQRNSLAAYSQQRSTKTFHAFICECL